MKRPLARSPRTIREWDRRAIEEYGLPGVVLMENAGAGATRWLLELARAGSPPPHGRWTILCGPGGNGGDGFVVARYLRNAGEEVMVLLACEREAIRPGSDSSVHLGVIERMGLPIRVAVEPADLPALLPARGDGRVIDALLGTGLCRPVRSPYREWIEAANSCGAPVAALDVPSGLDAETGEVLGAAVRARWTLTFAAPKVGFERGEGPAHTGRVEVVDIGMPREILEDPATGDSP